MDNLDGYFNMQKNQPYLSLLYKTMIALGYYDLFHIGELAISPRVMKYKDVMVVKNKQKLLIVLRSSKTQWINEPPQTVKIDSIGNEYCPYGLVIQYKKAHGVPPRGINEPFFIFRDSTPVKPQQFRTVLRKSIYALNLDGSLYDTHSLRTGCATDLFDNGTNFEIIKKLGRWKSDSVYKYLHYQSFNNQSVILFPSGKILALDEIWFLWDQFLSFAAGCVASLSKEFEIQKTKQLYCYKKYDVKSLMTSLVMSYNILIRV